MAQRRKAEYPLNKLMEIEWLDSATKGGWNHHDNYQEEAQTSLCKSVGYVLKDNKDMIVLVQTQSVTQNVTDSIAVPKGCIVKVRKLL